MQITLLSLYIENEGAPLDRCLLRQDNTLLGALKTDQKGDPGDSEHEACAFLINQLAKQRILQV